jgi:hypothetical protein
LHGLAAAEAGGCSRCRHDRISNPVARSRRNCASFAAVAVAAPRSGPGHPAAARIIPVPGEWT